MAKPPPRSRATPISSDVFTPEMVLAMLSQVDNARLSDEVDMAQEIMFEAWEAENPKRRAALARKALKVSEDCADAWLLLAQETATTPEAQRQLLLKAVAAGERALGPAAFEEDVGHFWGLIETRPYMRARHALAMALWDCGARAEAADHLGAMIRLNPDDNQGVRHVLMSWLLMLDRAADLDALLKMFKAPHDPQWAFPAALAAFRRKGDTAPARKAMATALASNPHVAPFLTRKRKLPREMPPWYSPGDRNEAVIYVADGGGLESWAATPGALTWLAGQV